MNPAIARILPPLAGYAIAGHRSRHGYMVIDYGPAAREVLDRLTPARNHKHR